MQIVDVSSKGLKHVFKIILEAQDLVDAVNAKLALYGQNVQMPGFRKGKVPVALLQKKYGNTVTTEVLEEKVKEVVAASLKQKDIKPSLRPELNIEPFSLGQDLTVTVSVEALPILENIVVDKYTLEKLNAVVTKEQIEKAVEDITTRHKIPSSLEKERPIQEKDLAKITYAIKEKGKIIEEKKDAPYLVGNKVLGEAFDVALIGLKKGDKKEIETVLPEAFFGKKLGGKKCVVEVFIEDIQTFKVPTKEELSKELGFEGISQLESNVADQLKQDYESLTRQYLKRQILDNLSHKYTFEVPEGMTTLEVKTIIEEEERQQKTPFSDKDREKFEKEYQDIAQRRVRLGLILADIGIKNNISVTQQELGNAIYRQARQYPGQEKQIVEYYRNNSQATAALQAPIFEEKVIDFIIEKADIKNKDVPAETLVSLVLDDEEKDASSEKKNKKEPTKKTSSRKEKD